MSLEARVASLYSPRNDIHRELTALTSSRERSAHAKVERLLSPDQ